MQFGVSSVYTVQPCTKSLQAKTQLTSNQVKYLTRVHSNIKEHALTEVGRGPGGGGWGGGGDVQSNVNEHSLNGGLGVVGSNRERERFQGRSSQQMMKKEE